jgi:hypothetical protein
MGRGNGDCLHRSRETTPAFRSLRPVFWWPLPASFEASRRRGFQAEKSFQKTLDAVTSFEAFHLPLAGNDPERASLQRGFERLERAGLAGRK